jgi:hypothetical protein
MTFANRWLGRSSANLKISPATLAKKKKWKIFSMLCSGNWRKNRGSAGDSAATAPNKPVTNLSMMNGRGGCSLADI